MEHIYHERDDDLLHCKVCNGGEGSLPTHCPGSKMPAESDESVYAGILDYVEGAWVPGVRQREAGKGMNDETR